MALQIRAFAMSQMTIASCSNFHRKINKLITVATPAALHIETLASPYANASTTLSSVVNRQRALITTAELRKADDVRDRATGLIYNMVRINLTSTVAARQAAAQLLSPQLSPYRAIGTHEYSKQTDEVNGMLAVLDKEENAEAVEALHLSDEIESLRSANNVFDELFEKRIAEYGEMSRQSDVKSEDLMETANTLYQQIVQVVNVFAIIQPTDEINQFVKSVDDTVRTFAHIAETGTGPSTPESMPEPEPVTPEITAVYQKEGGDPENPHRIGRDEQTMVEYQGFTLKGQDGTLDHVVALINDQDYPEWIKPATITNVTENSFEFTMVPDLTEGQYKVRIETYDEGSPLVVEYPEPITLW